MMRCITLAFAALLGLSAPALAQRAAPTEIRSNGEIWLGNAAKIGKREGTGATAKTVLTPDSIEAPSGGKIAGIPFMPSVLGTGVPGVTTHLFVADAPTTPTYATLRIDRNENYAGGGDGFTNSNGIIVNMSPGPLVTNSNWGVVSIVRGVTDALDPATSGKSTTYVGMFGASWKKNRRTYGGWGGIFQTVELDGAADPLTGTVGVEVNVHGQYSDANNQRVAASISIAPVPGIIGTLANRPQVSFGLLMSPAANDPTQGVFKNGIYLQGEYQHGIRLTGATCTIDCWSSPGANIDGVGNGNFAAVNLSAGGAFKIAGSTLLDTSAWTAYTPAVSVGTGSLGADAPVGWFKTIGKTGFVRFRVPITANGTGAGFMSVTLPWNVQGPCHLIGAELGTGGRIYADSNNGTGPTNGVFVRKWDGSYPGNDNAHLSIQGTCELL